MKRVVFGRSLMDWVVVDMVVVVVDVVVAVVFLVLDYFLPRDFSGI